MKALIGLVLTVGLLISGCATVAPKPVAPKHVPLQAPAVTKDTPRTVAWRAYCAAHTEADRQGLTGKAKADYMRKALNTFKAAIKQ